MKKNEDMLRLAGINEATDYPFNCGWMIGAVKRTLQNLEWGLQRSETYESTDQHAEALKILKKSVLEATSALKHDLSATEERLKDQT